MAGCLKQSRLQEALMDAVAGICCRTHLTGARLGCPEDMMTWRCFEVC